MGVEDRRRRRGEEGISTVSLLKPLALLLLASRKLYL